MKKLFFGLLFAASFGLTSCGGGDDCQTCSGSLIGIETTTEVCQDGDDLSVTVTALGQTATETVTGVSLSDYTAGLEAGGLTCN